MNISITDFLPKYPNIYNSEYDILNPYEGKFENVLFHKKEFYENRLDVYETFPSEKGSLTKYQKTISRFFSSYTPYNGLLLVHSMGTGKTCSAIGAIEQIKNESNSFTGAVIFGKGDKILDNFITELVEKCTAGQYKDQRYNNLDSSGKLRVSRKKIASFYSLNTFTKFAKSIKDSSDFELIKEFSNKIIVIDEVHNLRIQDEANSVENYRHFHRFLHVIKNCKILLLSGTPMKDTPQEIASVMNLILPIEDQFPEEMNFLAEYMVHEDDVWKMRPNKIQDFKNKIRGRVSFLREAPSSVEKVFLGDKHVNGLKHFIVKPLSMTPFQSSNYKTAFQRDNQIVDNAEEKKGKRKKSGFYSGSKEASLFIFPDGSYGPEGFDKYINKIEIETYVRKTRTNQIKQVTIYRYVLTSELRNLLKPNDGMSNEEILNNIKNYSISYYTVIQKILSTKGNCFIYSISIKGSGAILFSLLLELFGYSKANGDETTIGKRYTVIATETMSNPATKKVVDRFNKPDNCQGDYIQVIIGGKAASEGLSFKNVIFEAINTPWWNYPEIEQAIARGIRFGSHNDLLVRGITPKVEIMQVVSEPINQEESIESVDSIMYKTAEDKDISIRKILRLLMESAIDCGINYFRNKRTGEFGSRDCDYESCDYTCDNLNENEVLNGIQSANLDLSTYQLYYSNPIISKIKVKIEELFKIKNNLSIEDLQLNLKKDFNEEEIENTLIVLRENNITNFEKLQNFSSFAVKNISNNIEKLFRKNFYMSIHDIVKVFSKNSLFDILTSLQNIINNNVILIDKYGFHRYLRETNNVFFLVSDIGAKADFFTQYYTEYPTVHDESSFDDIMENINVYYVPELFNKLVNSYSNKVEFVSNIQSLPDEFKQFVLESCIKARHMNKNNNKGFRDAYLDFFNSEIKDIENTIFTTLNKSVRCFSKARNEWGDCDKDEIFKLSKGKMNEREDMMKNNPYGLYVLENPTTGKLCIVDFLNERKSSNSNDSRFKASGRVCSTIEKDKLFNMAVFRLKLKPDFRFEPNSSRERLIELVNTLDPSFLKFIQNENKINYPDDETMRSMIFFSRLNKPTLCGAIIGFLQQIGKYKKDPSCGVANKIKSFGLDVIEMDDETKSVVSKQTSNTMDSGSYNVEISMALDKKINIFMKSCDGGKCGFIERTIDELRKLSFVRCYNAYKKNTLYGFATENKEGFLENLIVKQTFHTRNFIYPYLVGNICKVYYSVHGKNPRVKINRKIASSFELEKQYKMYGFVIVSQTNEIIILEYKIK